MTDPIQVLLDWLGHTNAIPVDAKLVPGATESERRSLACLGAVARTLMPPGVLNALPSDLAAWLEAGPDVPSEVMHATKSAIASDPDGTLADIYSRLVSAPNRRALGTFFTPAQEVELMLDMWSGQEDTPKSVIDVGAGVGVFTASAATRWPDASVFAVDINPVTLGLLALRIGGAFPIRTESDTRAGVRLIRDDFTAWIAQAELTPSPRLILGNPPYTRAQLLPIDERQRLATAAGNLCGTRASLSTLITAITLENLSPHDGFCMLLPAQWLESQYAAPLRDRLARSMKRRIELRLVDSWRFVDAQVDAVALLVGSERDDDQPLAVANWRSDQPRTLDRHEIEGSPWRSAFDQQTPTAPRTSRRNAERSHQTLADWCTVRRGVATGANGFFVLTDLEVAEHRLPRSRLLPLARRLFTLPDRLDEKAFSDLDETEKRWLLHATAKHRRPGSALDRYLLAGEIAQLHERELCRRRSSDWYDLRHDIVVPDVIVGPMTRNKVRLVANAMGCAIVNNLYGLRWHPHVEEDERASILDWLRGPRGQAALLGAARRQGNGLFKIEPRALGEVAIPSQVARR